MNKMFKATTIGLLTIGMGVGALPTATLPVLARAKAAKLISTKKLKKTAYHANIGYLYSSVKLTKKAHNATNYPNTTFYATKSAKVKRRNGKKAVYYYVKNKKGNVKGWIWHGNLKKINLKNLAQRKSDIKKVVAAIRLMSSVASDSVATDNQDYSMEQITQVDTINTYQKLGNDGLPNTIHGMWGSSIQDCQAIIQANLSFKGRFDSVTNTRLLALSDRVSDAINADEYLATASKNLAYALADAVATLN